MIKIREYQWSIGSIIGTCVFVLLAAGLYGFSWNSVSAGFLSDDAVYLLMADSFSHFHPSEPELSAFLMSQTLFPPLYPLLLAWLGAGSDHLAWAHVITTTMLVLALGVYGLWIYAKTRDLPGAISLLLIFALLPGTLLHILDIFSEFPFLFFTLLAFLFSERTQLQNRDHSLIVLCVGLAAITRSTGLALVAAFGLWLFRYRIRNRIVWLLLALGPSLFWFFYKTTVLGNHGGYWLQWQWVLSEFQNQWPWDFLQNQLKALWQGLLSNFDLRPSFLTQAILLVTLLLGLPEWVRRLWHWHMDAWYLLISVAMILLWPYPEVFGRLMLPLLPIILFHAYLGIRHLTAGWGDLRGQPALTHAYLVALMLTLLPSLGFMMQRLSESIDPALASWKHTRYWFRFEGTDRVRADVANRQDLIHAIHEIGQWVPDKECVFGVHTALSMLHSRRIFHSPPPPPNLDSTEFNRSVQSCRYFLLLPSKGVVVDGSINGGVVGPFYPYDHLDKKTVKIVRTWEDPRDPKIPTAILLKSSL